SSYCAAALRHPHSFPTRRSSDLHPFAIAAIADLGGRGAVPQVAAGGPGDRVEVALGGVRRQLAERTAAVGQRPDLLDEVGRIGRSEEHTSELQSQSNLVCRLLLE